jgi:hypothetical protein
MGIDQFRSYLARLRADEQAAPPVDLLDDPAYYKEMRVDIGFEPQPFPGRLAVGEFLARELEPLGAEVTDRDAGLWAWLSLALFDQVCPAGAAGKRQPGQDYRHIPDFGYRHKHRHLLFGPFQLYRRHGATSALLLSGPLSSETAIYHEIASRQDLVAHRGVLDAARTLYLDVRRGRPKPGAQGSINQPGTVRRFVRVLQQLDVTYDIYGLSGRQIVGLLPPEFDVWHSQKTIDEPRP